MPTGFYLTDANGSTSVGKFDGDSVLNPLMTEQQALDMVAKFYPNLHPEKIEGVYVGCRDCPDRKEFIKNGCWDTDSDHCRRTKEG